MRRLLAGGGIAAIFVLTSTGLAARGFSDPAGDANAAPDITSVEISEPTLGSVTVMVRVANYQALPENSWVNAWFDVDANAATGDAGDEALVRYLSEGTIERYAWNGARLVKDSAEGIAGSFASGVLTLTVPRSTIAAPSAFGLLAVGSRGQPIGNDELIASDYAPDVGRSTFTGGAAAAFSDPANDHDAAPDLTAIRVSDAKSGWITFAFTTPNYVRLSAETALVVAIDADANPRTGESGADVRLEALGGKLSLERWSPKARAWESDRAPKRARLRNAAGVVSFDLHVSELGGTRRIRFAVLSADVRADVQEVLAVDFSPDDGSYWQYALANAPALTLAATELFTAPVRPTPGRPFTVALAVNRSDTGRPVSAGTVACRATANGRALAAHGRITGGAGRCTFVVPASARGSVVRGTITVRSVGKTISRSFSYRVR